MIVYRRAYVHTSEAEIELVAEIEVALEVELDSELALVGRRDKASSTVL